MAVVSSLPFCGARTSVTTFPEEQQDLERTSLAVLYSNVRSLRQAYGELCKTCTTHQPAIVCLTETHLFRRSWQITVVDLWNSIPADLLLKGEKEGWRTVLKDIQSFICTRP